jgi:hypothetical protein
LDKISSKFSILLRRLSVNDIISRAKRARSNDGSVIFIILVKSDKSASKGDLG